MIRFLVRNTTTSAFLLPSKRTNADKIIPRWISAAPAVHGVRFVSSSPDHRNNRDGTTPSSVWQRQAMAIKNTDGPTNNQYLEAMRAQHDPSLHLKTIEDELKGAIGQALGRQGQKILRAVRQMDREYQIYCSSSEKDDATRTESARRFNAHRRDALQARWELTVHRQAAGFLVHNHKYVTESYPIGPALPETEDTTAKDVPPKPAKEKKKKQFTDQLDWWQRIGRWR